MLTESHNAVFGRIASPAVVAAPVAPVADGNRAAQLSKPLTVLRASSCEIVSTW